MLGCRAVSIERDVDVALERARRVTSATYCSRHYVVRVYVSDVRRTVDRGVMRRCDA